MIALMATIWLGLASPSLTVGGEPKGMPPEAHEPTLQLDSEPLAGDTCEDTLHGFRSALATCHQTTASMVDANTVWLLAAGCLVLGVLLGALVRRWG